MIHCITCCILLQLTTTSNPQHTTHNSYTQQLHTTHNSYTQQLHTSQQQHSNNTATHNTQQLHTTTSNPQHTTHNSYTQHCSSHHNTAAHITTHNHFVVSCTTTLQVVVHWCEIAVFHCEFEPEGFRLGACT